ncbi:sigma-54 dependent transcriptional regulator [Sporosarcina newyorkensis 2681]|uniref:Sigma-54 dependent transcriptional regulator n=1 Tax=Sporosarcina newyorkensis 2681 TaxID=1027292 RepID=F9DXL6_9BACL|nr:sigma-54-dependent Fis family transcriptional regulator [Sporosarcina newyorkensis]EGQ20434.1 sigma-54 dependent transcriptional regulator [Sporosarcina newyorkensis 2681]
MLTINDLHNNELFEAIFENLRHCVVIVDQDGYITYINEQYCKFIQVKKEEAIGMYVEQVIENTRMHLVVRSGKEEIADLQYINGNYMVADRIPIRIEGEIIGAFGIVLFKDTEEWKTMNSHIKELLLELNQYKNYIKMESLHTAKYSLHDIIGSSPQIHQLKDKIKKVAPSDASILIRGESGTGKELIAHSVHALSERATKPFIKVNCAAIPEHLLESELFGYEEGAFTGANKGGKLGKFQLADGGTLFLDEIGDMPLNAQVKILRVLQEGEIEAVGSVQSKEVDVRIIAATNQPLEKLIEKKLFREDLFYRINVINLKVPSLDERPEDIRLLSKYILHKVNSRTGKSVIDISPEVYEQFMCYQWPGNIRELENVIEAAVHLTNHKKIQVEDLPGYFQTNQAIIEEGKGLKELMEQQEKQIILNALEKASGDKILAAQLLKVGKSSFYEKIKKYGI